MPSDKNIVNKVQKNLTACCCIVRPTAADMQSCCKLTLTSANDKNQLTLAASDKFISAMQKDKNRPNGSKTSCKKNASSHKNKNPSQNKYYMLNKRKNLINNTCLKTSRSGYKVSTSTYYLLPPHNSKFHKNILIYMCNASVLHVYTMTQLYMLILLSA